MMWLLMDRHGRIVATGSWHSVIEEGCEEGLIQRRLSNRDASEATPKLMPGCVMAPAPMFPDVEPRMDECRCNF